MGLDVSYSRRSRWLSVADRSLMPRGVRSGAECCDGEGAFAQFERLGRGPDEWCVAVRITATVVSDWQAQSTRDAHLSRFLGTNKPSSVKGGERTELVGGLSLLVMLLARRFD